jgi:hypothetical protein
MTARSTARPLIVFMPFGFDARKPEVNIIIRTFENSLGVIRIKPRSIHLCAWFTDVPMSITTTSIARLISAVAT